MFLFFNLARMYIVIVTLIPGVKCFYESGDQLESFVTF